MSEATDIYYRGCFGVLGLIMIGDPQQLKPVCDKPLYEKPDPKNVTPLGLM